MKLHLPKMLAAALFAAFVSFTQAQAVTLTEVLSMDDMLSTASIQTGATQSTVWEIAGDKSNVVYDFNGSGYISGINNAGLFDALQGSNYVTIAAWINPTTHSAGTGGGDGGSIFGFGGQNNGIKLIDQGGSLKMTTKGKADFNNAKASGIDTDTSTWQLVAVTYHKNGNNMDAHTIVAGNVSGTQTATGAAASDPATFAIGSGNGSGARELYQGSIAALTVFTSEDWASYDEILGAMYAAPTKIVYPSQVWAGTSDKHAWSDSVWVSGGQTGTYDPQYVAEFSADGHNEVSITAATTAKDVIVGGQNYTFELSEGASLTTGSLEVTSNKLTLSGTGTVAAESISASGKTIEIGSGVVLTGAGSGTLTGSGTYDLASGTATLGSISLGEGWTGTVSLTAVDANNLNFDNLTKGANSTLELCGYKGYSTKWYNNQTNVQNIRLVNDESRGYAWKMNAWGSSMPTVGIYSGTWTGDGTLSYETYSGNQAKFVNQKFTGDLSAWTGTLKLDQNGTLQLTVALSNPVWGAAIDRNQGVINMIVEKNAEFAKSVSVTSMDINAGQTVTLKGASTIDTLKGSGALIVNAGSNTATINGAEGLAKTITLNSGTLNLSGTIAISDDMEITGGGASYGEGQYAGNGFQTVQGKIQVVDLKGGTLNEGTVSYTHGGKVIATSLTEGAIDLAPTTSYNTYYVRTANTTESMAYAVEKASGKGTIASVVMSNATTLAADSAGSYALTIENGASATVNVTADTTISALTGTGSTLNITGDSVVTLAANSAFTSAINISGTATVKVGATDALGNAANTITVYSGATLDVNGKDAPANKLYTVTLAGGTLANTGGAVTYGSRQLVKALVVTADSKVNAQSNDFGVINGGYDPTTIELNANLEKVGSNGFHICNATFSGTGKLIISDGTLSIDKAKNYSSTFANDIDMNGGTLDGAFKLADAITITATGEGSAITANIKNEGNNITFAGDNDLTMRGVISGNGGLTKNGEGTLTLNGAQTYTGTTVVNSGKLVVNGTIASQEVTLGENASIENKGAGAVTLSDVDEHLMQVENTGTGILGLKNVSGTLSVMDLTIGAGSTVSFHNKAETPAEGTITVTESLTAGGGTLLANLILADGSALDLGGAGENALTLGSNLAFVNGGFVTLDAATLTALDALVMGSDSNYLELVKAAAGTTLTYGMDDQTDYNGMWFGQLFDRTAGEYALVGDFKVLATDASFGLIKVNNTPEPTTGTLSLLALAALAARRRRH